MHTLIAALSFSLLGAPTQVDVASSAEEQSRAGMLSTQSNEPTTPSFDVRVTLSSGIQIKTPNTTVQLRYRPQYYYQYPNILERVLPVFLHQFEGNLSSDVSQRTSVSWNASGTLGELSYGSLIQSFPDGTIAASGSLVPVAILNTQFGGSHALTKLNRLSGTAGVSHRAFYRSSGTLTNQTGSTIFGVQLSDAQQISRVDSISLGGQAGYILRLPSADDDPNTLGTLDTRDQITFGGQVGWSRRVTNSSGLQLSLGASGGKFADTPVSIFPTGSLGYFSQSRLFGAVWNSSFNLGVQAIVDPLVSVFRPQAGLNFSSTGQVSKKLSVNFNLLMSSSLTEVPVDPAQYESSFSAETGLNYNLGEAWRASIGARTQIRAGHITQLEEPTLQAEYYGLFRIRYFIGTGPGQGAWL